MNWLIILIISGLFVALSTSYTIRYGSYHFRMRDYWIFLGSFMLGMVSIFYLPLYVVCICWLITSAAAWTPVIRAFKHREDEKTFEVPKLHQVNRPMGKIVSFNSPESNNDPPNAA